MKCRTYCLLIHLSKAPKIELRHLNGRMAEKLRNSVYVPVLPVLGDCVEVPEVVGAVDCCYRSSLGELRRRPDHPSCEDGRGEGSEGLAGLKAGGTDRLESRGRKLPGYVLPFAPGGEAAGADRQGRQSPDAETPVKHDGGGGAGSRLEGLEDRGRFGLARIGGFLRPFLLWSSLCAPEGINDTILGAALEERKEARSRGQVPADGSGGPPLVNERIGVVVGLSGLHGEDCEARTLGEALEALESRSIGAAGLGALRPSGGLEEGLSLGLVVDSGYVGPPVKVSG